MQIQLFYVSQSHHLNSSYTSSDSLNWLNDSTLTTYTTAASTRSLAVASNPQSFNTTDLPANVTANLTLLFYEDPNGTVGTLLETGQQCDLSTVAPTECHPNTQFGSESGSSQEWIDVSPTLYGSFENATFSAPFTIRNKQPNFTVSILFYIGSTTPLDGVAGRLFLWSTYDSGGFSTSRHRRVLAFSFMDSD